MITPALTPDEWKKKSARRSSVRVLLAADHMPVDARHAVAALALDGMPYGFRHEDLHWLGLIAKYMDLKADEFRDVFALEKMADMTRGGDACRSLMERIAALLPEKP